MNGVIKKLLLLVAGIFLLFFVNAITSVIFDRNDMPDSQITVSTKLNDVSQSEIESVKKETRKALNFIPPILGIDYKKKIIIKIVDYGICNANRGVVSVPIAHIRDKSAAIIHEVTHIIAKHESNSFFSEGLAVYFQERFGEYQVFPNFSIPLDELVRNHEDQLVQITNLNNDNEIFRQVGTERRRIAYIEAGSFFNYLVVKYGEQKLADLHNSRTLNYKKFFGKKIKELEVDWKRYVLGETHENI
ncbi:hypothetical protein ACFLZQ_02840 [Thermodesulfobacteriota bacterium]